MGAGHASARSGRRCSRSPGPARRVASDYHRIPSDSRRRPFHSARIGDTGEIHYTWHPLVGQCIPIIYTEHRRHELVAICEMPDGSRAVVPIWMLDRASCATLSAGPPRCSVAALCDLRALLDSLRFHGRAPSHVRDGQEDDLDHTDTTRRESTKAVAAVFASRGSATTGECHAGRGHTAHRAAVDQRVQTGRGRRGTR